MGWIRHHAIVVTSWNGELLKEALTKATDLGCAVSGVVDSQINGYQSFLIAPDGSKEGWDDSENGDHRREAFKAWTHSKQHEDGSSSLRWAEVLFGDDDYQVAVTDDSDVHMRAPTGNTGDLK